MKLKAISAATLAALYSAGIAASVSQGWQPLNISAEKIDIKKESIENKRKQFDSLNPKLRQGATNRVFKKLKPEDKFTFEQDVTGTNVYIIQLKDAPIATYQGGVNGIPATVLQPVSATQYGQRTASQPHSNKLFTNSRAHSSHISQYQSYLHDEQSAFVSEAHTLGVPLNVRRRFTATLNAVTAELTQQDAAQLAKSDRVVSIERSILHTIDSDVGPQVIKADQLWTGQGSHDGLAYKGEGQVIGIIDTGINSDHVSFADVSDDGYDHTNPLGEGNYLGQCQLEEFAERCNDKLIGVYTWDIIADMYDAEYFQPGYPNHNPWNPQEIRPYFGEDYNGHGSHVAGTAAGNVVFEAPLQLPSFDADPDTLGNTGDGRDTGYVTQVSGVAPRANVVMYQACYGGDGVTNPYYGCPTEATLASIEQAVLDGVDVINYSISGDGFPWEQAIEQAFFSAYAAGISVAAAAGNGGFNSPTNHNSPWLLNVAATHHGRTFDVEEKTLGEFSGGDTTAPAEITGASISEGFTGILVSAENYGDKSCDSEFAPNTFSSDEIVMCERSNMPRMAKAEHVKAAGAGGFILYNQSLYGSSSALVTDMYPLPSIHIGKRDADKVLAWMASGSNHMATISQANAFATVDESKQNLIASFTSAKQNPKFDGTLTPSISAPGVQVFAPWSDDQPFTAYPSAADWNVIDGTSMASPHVAGALALIRQAHPHWSVAEVQSAAQMTANADMDDGSGRDPYLRGGSGLINVAAAVNAGLVMDETAINMELANPRNGGNPTTLNLPTLVDTSCEQTCSWMRTVTATKDGTWTVTGTPNHDAVSVEISASPATFSLKAGESQTIIVTAKILDAVTQNSSPENSYLFGNVTLESADADTPNAHWPMKIRFSRNDLPQLLNIEAHRDKGQYTIKDMPVSRLAEFNGRAFAAAKAPVEILTMAQDDDTVSPYFDSDLNGAAVRWIDVPMGSKRLFADVIRHVSSTAKEPVDFGDLDVFIGQDINNDGEISFLDETICWSYSATENDFCSISDPEPGKYWVIFHNYKNSWFADNISDTYEVAMGVISDNPAANITVSTDTIVDANTHSVDVHIDWDFANWQQGERVYSLIDLGSSADDAGNMGAIPLNITRGQDDVTTTASQSQAKAGDVIDVNVEVLANTSGLDRDFAISAVIPQGMQYVEGSATVDNIHYTQSNVSVADNTITVTGTQQNSESWAREYKVSTNVTDQSCRMPLSADGGYINLHDEGFKPSFGGSYQDQYRFKFTDLFQGDDHVFAPYENEEHMQYRSINISPQGWVQFDHGPQFWADHYQFDATMLSFTGMPDTMIAPMFRGSTFDGSLSTPLELVPDWIPDQESSGITIVYNDAPKALLIEWDDARTATPMYDWQTGETQWLSWQDSYDFQTYINLEYHYGDNQHEVVMAYDNITFAEESNLPITPWLLGLNDASIGLYGFYGPRGTYGPTYGGLATQFHYGDMSDVIKDGLVVCYDYQGPESTTFNLSFKVQMDNTATGQRLPIKVMSDVYGMDSTSHELVITSPSNITVAQMADMNVAEDAMLEGIKVVYHDTDKNSNVISVTGEHIEAVVHGHESGDTIDIAPVANFSGTTVVTVTVADKYFPSDAHSTQFTLNVMPENDAPTLMIATSGLTIVEGDTVELNASASYDVDGDTLSISWQGPGTISSPSSLVTQVSGLTLGAHTFTAVLTDGVESVEQEVRVLVEEVESSSSSGSLYLFTLLLPLTAFLRRKKRSC
ncbi:S8 family serine peptidase [Pseudoalteromonas sp. SSDWG2]|uniref:S8 family serine peptidase n=1 Tax=Pseudoalteromonas sp. SSDWG2 TaxID=3139391 RepID=UPI003BA894F1